MAANQSMEGAKILQVSTSKKSMLLDLGYAEGVKDGDRAKFYLKDLSEGLDSPKFLYVATGECIKVENKKSFWFLRKLKNFRFINEGKFLVMTRLSRDKRRPFITRRTLKAQGRSKSQKYYQVSEDLGVPEDLIFEEADFSRGDTLKNTETLKRQDIEVNKRTPYIKLTDEYDNDFKQVRKSFSTPEGSEELDLKLIENIEQKRKIEVFNSTTENSVGKYNNLKYGLKGFYKGQIHDGSNIRPGIDGLNIWQTKRYEKKQNRIISPAAISRIKKKGPLWSKDMSDQQLRKYIVDSGIAEEIERQKRVLEEREGSEFNIRYTSNLTENTTTEDPNLQSRDYGLSLSYEWHLVSTGQKFLKNFTIELEAERAISFYDVGGINARIQEGAFKGIVNWYFYRPPSSLYSYMPYLGIGIKRGNGHLETGLLDNTYKVQLMAVPTTHFGIKYRFKSGDEKSSEMDIGYGINFQLKYEKMRYNISDFLLDNIEPVFSGNQLRFSIGINVYL